MLFREFVSNSIADEKLADELGIEDKDENGVDMNYKNLPNFVDIISVKGFNNSLYSTTKNSGKQNLSKQSYTNISGQNGK